MTVADLIAAALKRINVVQAGDTPSPEDQADAFLRLNSLMGQWRLERLTIPYILRTTWTISSTKGTLANPYTVGTGGDINIARPPQPNEIVVKFQDTSVSPTIEYTLIPLTDQAWQAIPQKNLTSALPTHSYYNATYAGSLGSLYLWMVPTQASLQGVIYAPAAIANFAAVTDSIVLPDGYEIFLRDNLAVALAPEWRENVPIDAALLQSAAETKALVKQANFRIADLNLDAAIVGQGVHYDINADS